MGFEDVIVLSEGTSTVDGVVTPVIMSIAVVVEVPVSNESFVYSSVISPEPSGVILLRNVVSTGNNVDPVKGGTDSTIVDSLEMSVRVEDRREITVEEAVPSDSSLVTRSVVLGVMVDMKEVSDGKADVFSVLSSNEDFDGITVLLNVSLVECVEIKSSANVGVTLVSVFSDSSKVSTVDADTFVCDDTVGTVKLVSFVSVVSSASVLRDTPSEAPVATVTSAVVTNTGSLVDRDSCEIPEVV